MNQQKKEIDTLQVLRSVRIHDIALFDLVTSIVGCELVFRYFGAPKYTGAVLAVPIGMATHHVLGIKTKIKLPNQMQ